MPDAVLDELDVYPITRKRKRTSVTESSDRCVYVISGLDVGGLLKLTIYIICVCVCVYIQMEEYRLTYTGIQLLALDQLPEHIENVNLRIGITQSV